MESKEITVNLSESNSRTILHEKDLNEEYNPFEHRDLENGNSTTGSLIHLLKSSLGTGILAMPMAFRNGGLIFASVGTLVIGYLCTHCVHILVKTSHEVCAKIKQPSLGFAETAEAVFECSRHPSIRRLSKFARFFVDIAIMLTYFSACCVYIVFISTSIGEVINYYLKKYEYEEYGVRVYILLTTIPLLFIGQVRKLKYLVPFSAAANICLLISFCITLYYVFLPDDKDHDLDYMGSWHNLPMFFSTVIFAIEGIGVVMPVENSMKKPQHFLGCPGVLNTAMVIVVVLYGVLGIFGYMKYGDLTYGSVTENLPVEEVLAQVVKILIGLAILFTFGLQFYIPTSLLWGLIEDKIPKNNQNLVQICLRSGAILFMMALAEAVPNLEPFIGLVGAVFFSILGFLVPAVVETVHRWDGQLGLCKWVLWKNVILCIFSIFALIAGSLVSIEQIIELYQ